MLFLGRRHLVGLLEPAGTIMDINIGAALWIAARGVGDVVFPTPSMDEPLGISHPTRLRLEALIPLAQLLAI